MAQIDVSELMSDPDFCDKMIHVGRQTRVNSRGENILTEYGTETVGSVQPASGRVIARLPEALRVANLTSFWLKGKIVASMPGKYPDILVFRGQRYQVQTVFDWSNFGEGYCEGTCIAETPAP